MRLAVGGFLVFLCAGVPSATVHAQGTRADAADREARALFSAGEIAMSEGRYEAALEYFERAHELSRRPELLFNMGAAAERLRQDEIASEHYRAYLAAVPNVDNRREVERRIAILDASASPQTSGGESADSSVLSTWWFWTIVGVVAIGAGVTLGILLSDPGVADPLPAPGGVIITLGSP